MAPNKSTLVLILVASGLALISGAFSSGGTSSQTAAVRTKPTEAPKDFQVTNYVLGLPDAYIVYEPSKDVFQIAALGAVLSYGDGWERRQVKPTLFHLRHRSWKNHFWKVNTSRKEVHLVWGGVFGHTWSKPWPAKSVDVDGERENITLDVVGGAKDQVPQRFFLRFADAWLFFEPASRDLRLSAAGVTLSPCDDWEACPLKDYLFHVRLKTWKDFYWKVNTERMGAWKTTGGDFCRLGGEDKELALTMRSFERPFSIARLRTALAAAEKARLREIADMIEAGRPIAEINKASIEFVRLFPGVDVEAAVAAIARDIEGLDATIEELRKKREEFSTSFENYDQKTNQLFNVLSTVMKNMKEAQQGITRNIV